MIQLGQLDLQLPFMGTSALGEDIEDQTGAVDHPTFQLAFEVAFLAGRQDMVEDDQVTLARLDQCTQLLDLARADEKARAGLVAADGQEIDDFRAGRAYQLQKLMRVFTVLLILVFQVNEYGAFTPLMTFKKQSGLQRNHGLPDSASSPPCTGRRTGRPGTTVEMACL